MNFESPLKFGLINQHDEFSRFFEQQNLNELLREKEEILEKSNRSFFSPNQENNKSFN